MAHSITKMQYDDTAGRIILAQLVNEFRENYVLVGEEKTSLPGDYVKYAESLDKMEIRDSDIIVVSYPKSGTTWTQEMAWMIVNNLDFEGAKVKLAIRAPFLEFCMMSNWEKLDKTLNTRTPEHIKNSISFVEQQKDPRHMKTHLPFHLLLQQIKNGDKSPKIIYVVRNPKDVCISFYHHCRLLQNFKASLEEFAKIFLSDKAFYGSYWKHLLSYLKERGRSNILIIKYEDMKEDLPSIIRKVAIFLNKVVMEEQVRVLADHLSFDSMKNNNSVNFQELVDSKRKLNLSSGEGSFIRRGGSGRYKEEMSTELNEKFNEWIKTNINGTEYEKEFNYAD